MPTPRKPKEPKPQKPRPDVADKIRRGKAELRDDELTKVSGGVQSNKRFTCIE
jgi:hypothetical protein